MRILVSFDYELIWGTYERALTGRQIRNTLRANDAAEALLALNEELGVPATWAVVGVASDPAPLEERLERCSKVGAPVQVVRGLLSERPAEGERLVSIPPEFFTSLARSRVQELGSHSYAHVFSDVSSRAALEQDFALFRDLSIRMRWPPAVPFVAPKNQVDRQVLDVAFAAGHCCVRANPDNWLYEYRANDRRPRVLLRVLRFLDALLPLNEVFELLRSRRTQRMKSVFDGNFFFRPAMPLRVLDVLHRLRLRIWVAFAASTGRDVHLWTHPHNFGGDLERGLRNYTRVMSYLLAVSARHGVPLTRMGKS